jgi:hypothetical protein
LRKWQLNRIHEQVFVFMQSAGLKTIQCHWQLSRGLCTTRWLRSWVSVVEASLDFEINHGGLITVHRQKITIKVFAQWGFNLFLRRLSR